MAAPRAELRKLWDQSLSYYSAGDFERSRNLLLYLVKAEPSHALYWFNLGNSYFMLGQYKYAEICFYKVETLKSPLAPAAKLYRAKALKERGERASAQRMLKGLLKSGGLTKALREDAKQDLAALEHPTQPEGVHGEAMRLYRSGNYLRALRVIRNSGQDDDNVRMLKALILIKLDREDQAHEILSQLQTAEGLRDLARILLERIRNTYSKPLWLFAEISGGHDSNIYGASDATAAGTMNAQLGGGGRFYSSGLWYGTGGYSAGYREYLDYGDLRSLQHEARLNFGREVASDLIAISPFAVHETVDSSARRFASGAILRWRTGSEKMEFGFDGDWTEERALEHDYRYLTGNTHSYVFHGAIIHNPVYVRAQLLFARLDVGDEVTDTGGLIPNAHRAYGPGFTVLWRLEGSWSLEFGATYIHRDYPTHPSSGPIRKDKELSMYTRITKTFNPHLAVYTSAASRENDSTMGASSVNDENYSQLQIQAGVIWDAI